VVHEKCCLRVTLHSLTRLKITKSQACDWTPISPGSIYTRHPSRAHETSTLLHPFHSFIMRPFRLAYRTLYIQKRTFSCSHTFHSQKLDSKSGLLAGKRCIITGASRGIGAAIARRFAGEGGSCILVGRNSSLLDQVKESLIEIGTTERNAHQILVGDVGDAAFWERLKKEVSLSHSHNWVLNRCSRFSKSVEAFDN
jgi:hypothetical protein